MWKVLLSLFSGPLSSISEDLKQAYQSKLQAQNDKERVEADERIAILEARKTSIMVAQSDPYERFVRIGFAAPFIVYIWKLLIYDKVLGLGMTDGLSPELSNILMIVLGGYFIDTIVKRLKR